MYKYFIIYKYFTCIYHVTINQQRTMNKQMFIKIFILKCKNWVKDVQVTKFWNACITCK